MSETATCHKRITTNGPVYELITGTVASLSVSNNSETENEIDCFYTARSVLTSIMAERN